MDARRRISFNANTGGSTSGSIDTSNYLTILALEDGLQAKFLTKTISYSLDEGNTWTSLVPHTYTPTVNSGQTIMFKGNLTPNSSGGIGTFTINKRCNLEGNCMSLLFGDDAANNNSLSGKDYAFYNLFKKCTTIIQVSDTFLPATTLTYRCYDSMFYGCTSLTVAPELPATTLADGCYKSMFYNCTSLTTAPELPVTTLTGSCYKHMFNGCIKLNYIKMLATDVSASGCLSTWVYNVSSTGTFVKNPAMTSLPTGTSGIPSGWTVYNDGEEPEQETPQVAGDVAYYTNGEIKTISASKWDASLGTPIGVVVIPSNFLPDGKARIVSLKAVDSNGNATTSHSSMNWGNISTDTTLTNYTKVPITNNTGSVSSSSNSNGFLPSGHFAGDTSFVDSITNYGTTNTNKIPSPYNGSEFNPDYSRDISGSNALSDFNGLSNTQVLVNLGSDYEAANAAYNYSDGVSNTQWYLPSAGELGFLVARFKVINSTISMLSGVEVLSDGFWSSTEYSSIYAYRVYNSNGYVYTYTKSIKSYVRPFALLDNNGEGGGSNLITFTIDGTQYQAEEGMTWNEWVNSEYNTGGVYVESYGVIKVSDGNGQLTPYTLYTNDYVWVSQNDYIIDNKSYIFITPGGGS